MKLVIFLLLLTRSNGEYKNTQFMEQMPALVVELCPGSNICRANDSDLDEGYGSESMFRSCCTDCSCKPGCVDTNDCCFSPSPELPNCKSSGTLLSEDMPEIKSQCIYPKTSESKPSDALTFRSYYMITSENTCDTSNHKDGCGNQKVAPWGTMHPVFSKRIGKIYKNEVCANVLNITDVKFFDAILACKKFDPNSSHENDIINFFGDLERGEVSRNCHVQFSYPGDLNEINPQICYRDMIKECTSTEFQVPLYLNATKEEISDACNSGLLSPYFGTEHLYANVFCYICSGLDFYQNRKCSKFPDGKGVNLPDEFFSLLNLYEISRNIDVHIEKQTLMACPKDIYQHECRPVLCSSGKIRNAMGGCMFPTKVWYRQHYTVNIELSCDREIDIKEAFPFDNKIYIHDIDALYLSSIFNLNQWSILKLFYKTRTGLENDTTTDTLVVFMNQYFAAANPVSIMNNIDLLFKTKWFLEYKNETLLLEPSPFKHKGLKYMGSSPTLTPGSFTFNSTFSLKSPDYKLIYRTTKWFKRGFLVTKLYFCEQIELVREEYMLSADQSILYNKISHQYLFDGEFSLMYGSSEVSVRICLENSGFEKTNAVNCACAKSHLIAAFVLIVSISLATWYQPSSNRTLFL